MAGMAAVRLPNETSADLEYLFENQNDFDADKKKPHLDVDADYSPEAEAEFGGDDATYDPSVDTQDFVRYHRRLEDINREFVLQFVDNTLYNIREKPNANGIMTYNAKHYVQPTLSSYDGENEVNELADLLTIRNDTKYSENDIAHARQNLPYVVKRLHNLSKMCELCMLSLIAAYVKAKRQYEFSVNMSGNSQRAFKHTSVYRWPIYKCNKVGKIHGGITLENKNERVREMFNWLEGESENYQSYYYDYLDYVRYVEILNIDLDDDWTQYGESFIDSIPCTVVTPNSQYDLDVVQAIQGYVKPEKSLTEKIWDQTLETIDTFRNRIFCNGMLQEFDNAHNPVAAQDILKVTHILLCMVANVNGVSPQNFPKEKELFWKSGFLFNKRGIVYVSAQSLADDAFVYDQCVISELGLIINITQTRGKLYYMYTAEAKLNVQTKMLRKDAKLAAWRTLGR